jgi:hypothetical protein
MAMKRSLDGLAPRFERSSMTQRTGVMLALLCAWTVSTLAQPAKGSSTKDETPAGYTKVTGANLPEWVVWRSAFRALGRPDSERHAGEESWLPKSIGVEPSQLALILAASKRSAAAEHGMLQRQREMLDAMKAKGLDWRKEIKPALYELDYAQRLTTLQERDGLLLKLAPEARSAFEAWVQEHRNGSEWNVPTQDLEAFRRPS